MKKRKRSSLSGPGDGESEEKSSETGSDSVSTSEFNRPRSVNGAPSNCATTQTQSSITRHATPVAPYGELAFFKVLSFMEKQGCAALTRQFATCKFFKHKTDL